MGMTSTTGYDIWSEDNSKIPNYPRSTYEGHFKPHSDYPTSTYRGRQFKLHSDNPTPTYGNRHFKTYSDNPQLTHGERHFKPHLDNPTSTYGGRHFKPQDIEPSDPSKIAHIIKRPGGGGEGERHFKPPHLETNNPIETLNKATQQTPNEEDEVLKQVQKTQVNISL